MNIFSVANLTEITITTNCLGEIEVFVGDYTIEPADPACGIPSEYADFGSEAWFADGSPVEDSEFVDEITEQICEALIERH